MYIYFILNFFMLMINIYLVKFENYSLLNVFILNLLICLVLFRFLVISFSL